MRNIGTFSFDTSTNVEVPVAEPTADSANVSTCIMMNNKLIRQGEELIVYWKNQKGSTQKGKAASTWVDDAPKRKKPKA